MFAPKDTDGEILLQTATLPIIHTPFCEGRAQAVVQGGVCRITLPKNCAYALLRFPR